MPEQRVGCTGGRSLQETLAESNPSKPTTLRNTLCLTGGANA